MINSASNHGNFRKQANTLENNLNNVNTTLTNKINTEIAAVKNNAKSIYLPKNAKDNTIIQQQWATSNYTTIVNWGIVVRTKDSSLEVSIWLGV